DATAYRALGPRPTLAAGPGTPLPSSLPLPATVVTTPVSPRALVVGAVVATALVVVPELTAVTTGAAAFGGLLPRVATTAMTPAATAPPVAAAAGVAPAPRSAAPAAVAANPAPAAAATAPALEPPPAIGSTTTPASGCSSMSDAAPVAIASFGCASTATGRPV